MRTLTPLGQYGSIPLLLLLLMAFASYCADDPWGRPNPNWGRDAAARMFKPTDVKGLQLWVQADDIVGNDGDVVTTWSDRSGQGHNLSQGSSALKPILKLNIVNGHRVVRFDGTDDMMNIASIVNVNDLHFFYVVQYFTVAASPRNLLGNSSSPIYPYIRNATSNMVDLQDDNGTNGQLIFSDTTRINQWYIWEVHESSLLYKLTRNKVLLDGDNPPGPGASWKFDRVGWSENWVNLYGDIAELLIYNRELTSAEQIQVQNYLNRRYGLW